MANEIIAPEPMSAEDVDVLLSQARVKFIENPMAELGSVARDVNLPVEMVHEAASKQEWNKQRVNFFADKFTRRNLEYRELASQKQLPMLTKQLDLVERMQHEVLRLLDSYSSGHDLMLTAEMRRLTEVLSGLTSNMATLLGLNKIMGNDSKKETDGTEGLFYFPNAKPIRAVEGNTSNPPYENS